MPAAASEAPDQARAWVRAPDLAPGQVIQGDVKVKLDGSCGEVSSYTLVLQFLERSWVKTASKGANLPARPTPKPDSTIPSDNRNRSIHDPETRRRLFARGVGRLDQQQYEKEMMDPALCLREEERLGFEIDYLLDAGDKANHDMVASFAILVPSTNYPPAYRLEYYQDNDDAESEHFYRYFVDVTYMNGDKQRIPAGCTSFNAVMRWPLPTPETVEVVVPREKGDQALDEFTLEVTFPHGRHFENGSTNRITVVSCQVGPGLKRPLALKFIKTYVIHKCRWAANFAADYEASKRILKVGSSRDLQLWPTINDNLSTRRYQVSRHGAFTCPRFSQDGIVESGTPFSTNAVTVEFQVEPDCYPPFEMYYQDSVVELSLNLNVCRVLPEAEAEPRLPVNAALEEDVYDWTPILPRTKFKSVTRLRGAKIPIFVHRTPENGAPSLDTEPTHYLSPGARTPVFVDPSSVTELLSKTIEQRDCLAPISRPEFRTWDNGDVIYDRYKRRATGTGTYYVGDTWLRKVLTKRDSQDGSQDE